MFNPAESNLPSGLCVVQVQSKHSYGQRVRFDITTVLCKQEQNSAGL